MENLSEACNNSYVDFPVLFCIISTKSLRKKGALAMFKERVELILQSQGGGLRRGSRGGGGASGGIQAPDSLKGEKAP
jgi:hypothetical protein